MHNLVLLDVCDLWHAANLLHNLLREAPGIARDMAVVDLLDTRHVVHERVRAVRGLQEAHVGLHDGAREVVLENDDIRVVDAAMGVLNSDQGRQRKRRGRDEDIGAGREGC